MRIIDYTTVFDAQGNPVPGEPIYGTDLLTTTVTITGATPTQVGVPVIIGYTTIFDSEGNPLPGDAIYGTIQDINAVIPVGTSPALPQNNPIVDAIIGISNWIEVQMRTLRGIAMQAIIDNINTPERLLGALAITFVAELILQIIWDQIKGIEWIIKTLDFIASLSQLFIGVLSYFQVDTIFALIQLGARFDSYMDSQLILIYKALGSLSKEIGRDFSYVTVIAEINRNLLYTANRMLPNPWLTTQAEYATGFSNFLGGIKANLVKYTSDPESIFTDLSIAISKTRLLNTEDDYGKTAADASNAVEWIAKEGRTLVNGIDSIFSSLEGIDTELMKGILVWFEPFKNEYSAWKRDVFNPVSEKLNLLQSTFDSTVQSFGVDIQELKRQSGDPMDWLLKFLGLPETEGKASRRLLRDKLNEIDRIDMLDITNALGVVYDQFGIAIPVENIQTEDEIELISSIPISGITITEYSAPFQSWFVEEPIDSLSSVSYNGIVARLWYKGE